MPRAVAAVVIVGILGAGVWYFSRPQPVDPSVAEATQEASTFLAQLNKSQGASAQTAAPVSGSVSLDNFFGSQPAAQSTQSSSAAPQTESQTPAQAAPEATPQHVAHATLHTSKGDITIEFLPSLAPNAVANFLKLASSGFYNQTKFHRVLKGFMIQGGDPLSKDDAQMAKWGTGGPGYTFADEIGPNSHNSAGMVAMANSGPNTNGSQFFINAVDNTYLDGKYTVFGRVVKGLDIVQAIDNTPTDSSDRPVQPITISSVELTP